MLRRTVTCVLAVLLVFGSTQAQVPASAPPSGAYAYSIQYVPSDGRVKYAFRKVDAYDRISQYLQERICKLVEERGLHLAKPSDPASFRVTIQLVKANASDVGSNPLRTFGQAGVFLTANISVADGSGNLLFTHEYKGKDVVAPGQSKRIVVLASDVANGVVRKLDSDDSFNKVVNAGSRFPARGAEQATETAEADARAVPAVIPISAAAVSPRSVFLPVGTPVIVAFSDEVLLPLNSHAEFSKKNTQNIQSGDPVSLVLAEDIKVGDAVVAKAGSKIAGVTFEKPPTRRQSFAIGGGWGSGGETPGFLRVRVTFIAIGDREVYFRGAEAGTKKDSIVPGAELLGNVRKIKHGEFADIDAGTRVRVFTTEDATVPSLL